MQPEAGREAKKMKYVGVDIGKWRCRAAIMNPDGVVVDEFTFPNDGEGILSLASRLTTEDRGVMESTGSVWETLSHEGEPPGFEAVGGPGRGGEEAVEGTLVLASTKHPFMASTFFLPSHATSPRM